MPYKYSSPSGPAVDFVTQGSYNRELISITGQNATAGTEVEIPTVASNIIANDSRDALFSWVRIQMIVLYSGADFYVGEYALIRCDKDDATQDLNTSSVMEALQKQGRVLHRGMFCCGDVTSGGNYAKINIEKFKVVLPDDEELRLLIRPLVTLADSGIYYYGVLEWREVGA